MPGSSIKRRDFLMTLGWGAAILPPLIGAGCRRAKRRPNIFFCIADDWGWPHAGAYGDSVVQTPTFDRLTREGVLFSHAYVSSPSCTPCRNALLTGQYHWRLEEGANLWSTLDVKFPVFPLLLEEAGYHVGHWRKCWGPGDLKAGGYSDIDPGGKNYPDGFSSFMAARPRGKPFCFWLGTSDPHRPYEAGSGEASGMDL
jgi:N-sulfoglucosamine sulfohydrolase